MRGFIKEQGKILQWNRGTLDGWGLSQIFKGILVPAVLYEFKVKMSTCGKTGIAALANKLALFNILPSPDADP